MTIEKAIADALAEYEPRAHPIDREKVALGIRQRDIFGNELTREAYAKPEHRKELLEIVANYARENPETLRPVATPEQIIRLRQAAGEVFKGLEGLTLLRELQNDLVKHYEAATAARLRDAAAYDAAAMAPAEVKAPVVLTAAERAADIAEKIGSDSAVKKRAIERSIVDAERLDRHAAKTLEDIGAQRAARKLVDPRNRLTEFRLAAKRKKV